MTTSQRELQQHADSISFALICAVVVWRLIDFVSGQYLYNLDLGLWSGYLDIISPLISLLIAILALSLTQKVRVQKPAEHPGFVFGLTGLLLFLACCGAVKLLDISIFEGLMRLGIPASLAAFPVMGEPISFIGSLLSLIIVPAILEEYLFRGQILTLLEPYGNRFALIISSLLFALLSFDIVQLPGRFIMGLLLGWLVQRGCSVLFAMILRLLAGVYLAVYSYSISFGGPYQTIWYGLLAFSALCLVVGLILLLVRRARRKRAPHAGQPKLVEEQKLYRFFISIPSIALMVAVVFLYIQTLAGW